MSDMLLPVEFHHASVWFSSITRGYLVWIGQVYHPNHLPYIFCFYLGLALAFQLVLGSCLIFAGFWDVVRGCLMWYKGSVFLIITLSRVFFGRKLFARVQLWRNFLCDYDSNFISNSPLCLSWLHYLVRPRDVARMTAWLPIQFGLWGIL